MNAALRTVDVEGFGKATYDSDMPIGLLRGLLTGASEGDLGELIENLAGFVTEWPFEGDPSDPAAWDGLRRSEFNVLVKAVTGDLGSLGEE